MSVYIILVTQEDYGIMNVNKVRISRGRETKHNSETGKRSMTILRLMNSVVTTLDFD